MQPLILWTLGILTIHGRSFPTLCTNVNSHGNLVASCRIALVPPLGISTRGAFIVGYVIVGYVLFLPTQWYQQHHFL